MRRALLPWLIALAMVVGVLVAATDAVWLTGVLLILVGGVLIPFGLAALRRSDTQPPQWMDWNRRRER